MEAKWDEARVERTVRELLSRRGLRGTGRTRQIGEWRRLLGYVWAACVCDEARHNDIDDAAVAVCV